MASGAQEAQGAVCRPGTSCLTAKDDKYGGKIIDESSLPSDDQTFIDSLRMSLEEWRMQGKKGIWLKLPNLNSNLVNPAIKAGFRYHHAEPEYVMLVSWLSTEPCTLPANASHQIGVGAFVLNARQEILAVQERAGPFQESGIWKMPTGVIKQGEDIKDGAIREVKEETGIETEFVEVIGFRQSHKSAFDKSDLFFLCVLRPYTSAITKQNSELLDVKWMALSEYQNQEYLKDRKMMKKMLELCIEATSLGNNQSLGFEPKDMQAGTTRKPQYFYYNPTEPLKRTKLV